MCSFLKFPCFLQKRSGNYCKRFPRRNNNLVHICIFQLDMFGGIVHKKYLHSKIWARNVKGTKGILCCTIIMYPWQLTIEGVVIGLQPTSDGLVHILLLHTLYAQVLETERKIKVKHHINQIHFRCSFINNKCSDECNEDFISTV